MDIEKIKKDKVILEKMIMAYWISIPTDSTFTPEKIEIERDNKDFFNVNLIRNSKIYGMATIDKKELDIYLEKVKDLKIHEIDIIARLEKEIES